MRCAQTSAKICSGFGVQIAPVTNSRYYRPQEANINPEFAALYGEGASNANERRRSQSPKPANGVGEHIDLGRFRQHRRLSVSCDSAKAFDRVVLFGKGGKQFGLARHIVVHRYDDRRFDLVDDFDNVFETQIGHRIDGYHHDVDPLQHFDLLVSQQVADITQVGQA